MGLCAMGTIAIVAAAILLFIVVLVAKKKSVESSPETWPFYQRKPLSVPEQVLYFRLVNALPGQIVLGQVQLSRLLGVKKGNNAQAWLNRINRMSADFVICNKDSSILAVIELDDASHNGEKRKQADAKKDKALAAAGIKIHHWHVNAIPDESAIKATLLSPATPSIGASA